MHRHVALRGRRPRDAPRQDQRPALARGRRHAMARATLTRPGPRALQTHTAQGPQTRERLPQQEPAMRQDRRLWHRQDTRAPGRPRGDQGGESILILI